MARAPDLFGPRPPRRSPRVMMHAVDAGHFGSGQTAAHFRCARCGHDTGWVACPPSNATRGRACPRCNPKQAADG